MKKIKSNFNTLQPRKDAKPKLRKAIIVNCTPELLKCICECVVNALKGNVNLSSCAKRRIQKHKGQLRKVANKSISLAKKKRIIVQRGALLSHC
jgi:hypothetical protein